MKLQVSIPVKTGERLQFLVKNLGYTKSHIVAMAIDAMAKSEKEEEYRERK